LRSKQERKLAVAKPVNMRVAAQPLMQAHESVIADVKVAASQFERQARRAKT
jgi:hypothetical protein